MIRATHIHSLTEFTRNARAYIQQIRANKAPIAITVNGDAQVVVLDVETYQKMVDELESARSHAVTPSVGAKPGIPETGRPFSMVKNSNHAE